MLIEDTNRPRIGVGYLIVALGLTGAVDAVAKWLSTEFTTAFVTTGYFLAMTVVYLSFLVSTRQPVLRLLQTGKPLLQIARPALLTLALLGFFGGLRYMPLADTTTIFFSSPLIITALSGPLLGERVGIHRWLAVVVGMIGVVVVIGPGTGSVQTAAILPLLGALAWAGFHLTTQTLMRTEQTATTLIYTFAGATIWSGLMLCFDWQTPDAEPLKSGLIFLAIGVLGVAAHFAMLRAHTYAQASYLAPFNYIKLIWAAFFGFVLFNDLPNLRVISGAAIIITSGIYVAVRERRIKQRT